MKGKIIINSGERKSRALALLMSLPIDQEHEFTVKPYEPNRTLEQNAKMWAMLTDLSEQVDWHGYKLTPEDWKNVLTAGLKSQRAVPGIDGGWVVLGQSTSRMKVKEMRELIDLALHFGDSHEVRWSKNPYEED